MLDACSAAVRPGVTTDEIDRICHEVTLAGGGYPSPLNYCSFPKSCCTSVNEVICHGIPDARPLEDGDIVNLDISVYLGGFHADLNETVCVGSVDAPGRALVANAWQCLSRAIAMVRACESGGSNSKQESISTHIRSNPNQIFLTRVCSPTGEAQHAVSRDW